MGWALPLMLQLAISCVVIYFRSTIFSVLLCVKLIMIGNGSYKQTARQHFPTPLVYATHAFFSLDDGKLF